MTLREKVEAVITKNPTPVQNSASIDQQKALIEAELMAEEFSSVKPVPYVVPMERFAGMPYFQTKL